MQHLTRLKSKCSWAMMSCEVQSSSELTRCCQNWVLYKYKTEVSVSLLAVRQQLLSHQRGHSQVFATWAAAIGRSRHSCTVLQGQQVKNHCCLEPLWLLLRTDLIRPGVPKIIFLLINLKQLIRGLNYFWKIPLQKHLDSCLVKWGWICVHQDQRLEGTDHRRILPTALMVVIKLFMVSPETLTFITSVLHGSCRPPN